MMRTRSFLLLSSALMMTAPALTQELDSALFEGMSMRQIGPAGMSGRVTTIDAVMDDPTTIYVGTASGGLWKSTSGGTDWDAVFDEQPVMSIGAVAITQSNPDIVWAGTGEGNPRNTQSSGAGIYKSMDGGKSWKLMGLEDSKTIHRIIVDHTDPNTVYVGATGSAWGPNEERGVFKTTDGGKTWDKILYVNDSTGCADLVVDPINPNKLIAAMWQYNRQPWFFTSGGQGSGLYITYDGGENWKKLGSDDGLPKGTIGRTGLTICHSKPNIVYALIESAKTGIYKSMDGGNTWKFVNSKNVGNRPFYYADIYVHPTNENRIYNLWSMVSKSEDGGKTFKNFMTYANSHPDHHAFWINTKNPNHMIEGNDGGMNITMDGGATWRFVENLPVAQFYHINHDMDIPYNVYGGMQDNGSWVGPSEVWHSGGIKNHDWQEVLFGDGFDVLPKAGHSRYGYAMYQGGGLNSYDRVTGRTQNIRPVHPEDVQLRFNWNAPLAQDPFNPCGVYYGSQFLHKSLDCGQSWKIISPDLTTNDTTKQRQVESGGLTIDATKAENFTTILAIAPSPKNENVIWVGTDDGNLWVTRDGGDNWTKLNDKLTKAKVPTGSWIPQIVPSKHDEGEAFIVVNDYRRNNWKPYLVKASDYGKKMESLIRDNIKGHALSIEQDHVSPDLLFMGTEFGLYFSINAGDTWHKWTHKYPSVPTMDLKIHPRDNDLIIGTFGRAAYILDDIKPLRALAERGTDLLEEDLVVIDAQDLYLRSWSQGMGARFGGATEFSGDNKWSHSSFTYYLKDLGSGKKEDKKDKTDDAEDDRKKKKKEDWEHVHIHIINVLGDTVRSFKRKAATGFQRVSWDKRISGPRLPGSKKPKDGDYARGVKGAMPGSYKAIFVYGPHKDTGAVNVKPDPREDYSAQHALERNKIIDGYLSRLEPATLAHDFLEDAKEAVGRVNRQTTLLPDSTAKKVKKQGKEVMKEINTIMDEFKISEDFEGYDHVTERLISRIWGTLGYLGSSPGIPGPNAMNHMKNTEAEIKRVVTMVNEFMSGKWKSYREFVEGVDFEFFEEDKPIKME